MKMYESTTFGIIERIIEESYINGSLSKTRFKMLKFDTKHFKYREESEYFDFDGPIPREYVGMEARYYTSEYDVDNVNITICELEIITMSHDRKKDQFCYNQLRINPTIPPMITSQKRVNLKPKV